MKKIISIILAVALSLNIVPVLAESGKIVDEFYSAMDFNSLGISSNAVTRGEFAKMVMDLYGFDTTYRKNQTGYFIDVSSDDTFYDAVCFLQEMGIVKGDGSRLFLPNDSITISEACTILIRVMQCEYQVENGNYLYIANYLGLLNNVACEPDGTFNMDTAKLLIYNTLHAKVPRLTVGSNFNEETSEEQLPYMEKVLGIYEIKGRVTDNGLTSLTGNTSIKAGRIIVGDTVYVNETGRNDLIGQTIVGYYKINHQTDEKVLLYARELGKSFHIEADILLGYDDNVYTFERNDKEAKIRIKNNFNLIYNGVAFNSDRVMTKEEFKAIMVPQTGSVHLIDGDNNGDYETVVIKNYTNIVVGSVDLNNKILTDKLPTGKMNPSTGLVSYVYNSFDLSEADSLNIRSSNGTETPLSSLRIGDVVSVALSLDGKVGEIILGTEVIDGTVDCVDDDTYYVLENEYELSGRLLDYRKYLEKTGGLMPKAGDEVVLYLDFEGKIAYFKVNSAGNKHFAYLADVDIKKDVSGDYVICKLVMDTKEIKVCKVAENAEINGVKHTSPQSVIKTVTGQDSVGMNATKSLIYVAFNSNGEINYLDTPYKDSGENPYMATEGRDSLHLISSLGEGEKKWYSYDASSFEGIISVDANTVMFVVPTDTDEVEQILVSDFVTTFKNNMWRYPTAFRLREDSMVADAVILSEKTTGISVMDNNWSESCKPYVVTSIFDSITENGELNSGITLRQSGQEITCYTSQQGILTYKHSDGIEYKVSVGDIIQYGYDKFGLINPGNIRIMYDCETDTQLFTYANTELYDSERIVNRRSVELQGGWINRTTPTHFELALKNPKTETLTSSDKLIFSSATASVLIYNKARKSLNSGSMADLIPYENGNDNCSRVMVFNQSGTIQYIVVYR